MNWNIKKTNNGLEVTVTLGAREKARQPLIGVSVTEAREYLEENGHSPGKCLNPGALAGNLDKTRLTATWFFEDASKKMTKKVTSTKKTSRKTSPTKSVKKED